MNRISDEQRFWSKVDKSILKDGCWLFTGSLCRGYGKARMNKAHIYAHRMSWLLAGNSIPENLFVLHRCDVRNCVNPNHLFLGTLEINNSDRDAKGRHNCLRGENHPSHLRPETRPRGENHPNRLRPERMSRGDAHYARVNPEKLARGEGHGVAKLTNAKVVKIKQLRETGEFSLKEIAEKFEVCRSTIGRIVNGTYWRHVS